MVYTIVRALEKKAGLGVKIMRKTGPGAKKKTKFF